MTGYTTSLLSSVAITALLLLQTPPSIVSAEAANNEHVQEGMSIPKTKCGWRNKDTPACLCRYPINWDRWICKQYFQQGDDPSPRIIDGIPVTKDTYPWFARAVKNNNWGGCGGSLVAPEWVLTAAHCVEGNKPVDKYQIGALCPKKANNCGQKMVTVGVDEIHSHPNYNPNSMANDFALVKLNNRVTGITPVKMDSGNVVNKYKPTTRGLYAIGFGNQDPNNQNFSKELRHVELGYVTNAKCKQMYGGNDIKPNMMCAADPGQDACQGDSGGPLFDANKGTETLVGVVSWGYGCADPSYPGVYAKISNKWNWIKQKICGNHSDPKPDFCSNQPTSSPVKRPTSDPNKQPTSSPIKQPTPSPTKNSPSKCGSNKNEVEVVIQLDKYPMETSWRITDSAGVKVFQGGKYKNQNEMISEKACLNKGVIYKFTIKDTYGDGLSFNGSYLLKWDGKVVANNPNGEFLSSMSHKFGHEINDECGSKSGKKMIKLKFKTDEYGSDTYFQIKKGTKVILDGGYDEDFDSNQLYEKSLCVPDGCYKLIFHDESGDGMCCEHKKGFYRLEYDEKFVRFSWFKKGYRQITKFGTCS